MEIDPASPARVAGVLQLNYTRKYLRIKPTLQSDGEQGYPTVVEEWCRKFVGTNDLFNLACNSGIGWRNLLQVTSLMSLSLFSQNL